MHPIVRLKKTWKLISTKSKEILKKHEAGFRPLNNWAGYRAMIRTVECPTVPHVAVTTKDMVALEEMSFYDDARPGLFDWSKIVQVAKILSDTVRNIGTGFWLDNSFIACWFRL